jgi:hypothetical protein
MVPHPVAVPVMGDITENVTESPATDGPVTVAVIELVVMPFPVMADGLAVTATLFTIGFTVIGVLPVFPEFDSVAVTVQVPAAMPATLTGAVTPPAIVGSKDGVMVHGPETVKSTSSPTIPVFEAPVTWAVTADAAPPAEMMFGVALTATTSAGDPPWLSTRADAGPVPTPLAVAMTGQKPDVAGVPAARFGLVYVILAWPELMVFTVPVLAPANVPQVPVGSDVPKVNVTGSALAGVPLSRTVAVMVVVRTPLAMTADGLATSVIE